MKKESLLVFYYILYFIWLFTIIYLAPDSPYLNYFTIGVLVFYFVFLREKMDLLIFLLTTSAVAVIMSSKFSLTGQLFKFNEETFFSLPIWLVLAWSTTVLALRKLIIIVYR